MCVYVYVIMTCSRMVRIIFYFYFYFNSSFISFLLLNSTYLPYNILSIFSLATDPRTDCSSVPNRLVSQPSHVTTSHSPFPPPTALPTGWRNSLKLSLSKGPSIGYQHLQASGKDRHVSGGNFSPPPPPPPSLHPSAPPQLPSFQLKTILQHCQKLYKLTHINLHLLQCLEGLTGPLH